MNKSFVCLGMKEANFEFLTISQSLRLINWEHTWCNLNLFNEDAHVLQFLYA